MAYTNEEKLSKLRELERKAGRCKVTYFPSYATGGGWWELKEVYDGHQLAYSKTEDEMFDEALVEVRSW